MKWHANLVCGHRKSHYLFKTELGQEELVANGFSGGGEGYTAILGSGVGSARSVAQHWPLCLEPLCWLTRLLQFHEPNNREADRAVCAEHESSESLFLMTVKSMGSHVETTIFIQIKLEWPPENPLGRQGLVPGGTPGCYYIFLKTDFR